MKKLILVATLVFAAPAFAQAQTAGTPTPSGSLCPSVMTPEDFYGLRIPNGNIPLKDEVAKELLASGQLLLINKDFLKDPDLKQVVLQHLRQCLNQPAQ